MHCIDPEEDPPKRDPSTFVFAFGPPDGKEHQGVAEARPEEHIETIAVGSSQNLLELVG